MTVTSSQHSAPRQDGPSTMLCNEDGWWEEERAHFIRDRIVEITAADALIADIGCGRGRLLADERLGRRRVVNVDSHVWDDWKGRDDALYVCASADALPFRDGLFDLVGSFDVLEHIPDDETGLTEQRRIVRPSGHVVTAVPADQRLWSGHDTAAGHFRRYDVESFTDLSRRAGLTVERTTGFFSFLWVPAWLTRKKAVRAEPGNGTGWTAAVLRRGVAACSAAERFVLRRRRVPFGTSLWIESRPTGSDT